jgi:hypothetical protein
MTGVGHPDDLLPWYANHTLPAAELEAVDAHLRSCSRCRGELAFLRGLREHVKASADVSLPDEVGLKRLLRQVRRSLVVQRWLRPALAAAVTVIVVQAGLIAWLWPHEPGLDLLGGSPREGVVLQVRFDPTAPEARIRALLQERDAAIIDGPGALGVYRLRLPDMQRGNAEALGKTLADFQREKGIVLEVELEK